MTLVVSLGCSFVTDEAHWCRAALTVVVDAGFEPIDDELLELEPLKMLEMALRTRLARQGAMHVEVAYTYVHQADAFWAAKDYDKVIELYDLALEILKEVHGPESKQVAQLVGYKGLAHIYSGRWEHALHCILNAMALVEKAFEARLSRTATPCPRSTSTVTSVTLVVPRPAGCSSRRCEPGG